MWYNLDNKSDLRRFHTAVQNALKELGVVEFTRKARERVQQHEGQQRTSKQNRYFYLLIGKFALEYGETADYVKQKFFKKTVSPDIFYYERVNRISGEVRPALKSSADISIKEMAIAITRFRNWSAKQGIYLPSATNKKALQDIDVEIKNNQEFL